MFALAVGALNSCAVDNLSLEEDYIHAIMENDDTRTTVTDEGSFTWSSGDKIWLHTTSGSVVGTLSSGAGTSSANFSFSSHFGEMTGMAVYPYNSDHSVDGDVLSVVLPASYELGSNLTNTNAAMFGVTIDGTLNFTHLAGVMRFVFKNVPAGTDKFKITLDKKINGTFTADLTQECPVLESEETSVDAEKTITFNFDALTSTSDIRLYVPLPLGTYKTLALELSAGNQSVWTYSNTVTNKINRKSLKLMPIVSMGGSIGGEIEGGSTGGGNLSSAGTANSYIVSESGSYTFTPTKGNSNESVGEIASADVLWETFGTDVTPNVWDLVRNVKYADGVISFETPSTYREGNAVIAAKDASGTILWSWHIWLTDQPEGQEYYSLCTMMDRNLGATSATPGDVGALGLLYQWGRKDPFLGSSSIHYESMTEAKSTITWPSSVSSDSSTGTIAYATANPTTFITENSSNYDWYYTGDESTDNTRWKESTKSIYDPCPAGWRVPNGGSNGVWANALGSSDSFKGFPYDSTIEGISLPGNIWYPASGYRYDNFGSLEGVGNYGFCWSASTSNIGAYGLGFNFDGDVYPSEGILCSVGISVRCLKESSASNIPSNEVVDLSKEGTANSYIVSESGSYTFTPTKGNSNESVGEIASADVLWETFGTDVTPNVWDLVRNVKYADGVISFETPSTYREGNAVIAAKDASGTILWSWHIWLTDQPEGQEYYNDAGTMMDRNLGATSATPGDVGALGLLYQWGRKDPFLGSSSITESVDAKSTIIWPQAELKSSSTGTIEYVTAHPTVFVKATSYPENWHYSGHVKTLWTSSQNNKSIYDPCPAGWRVPDGGNNGVWAKALGSSSDTRHSYNSTDKGMNFSGKFGDATTIWYPVAGTRGYKDGVLISTGIYSNYWSSSSTASSPYYLYIYYWGDVWPAGTYAQANCLSVRCIHE